MTWASGKNTVLRARTATPATEEVPGPRAGGRYGDADKPAPTYRPARRSARDAGRCLAVSNLRNRDAVFR